MADKDQEQRGAEGQEDQDGQMPEKQHSSDVPAATGRVWAWVKRHPVIGSWLASVLVGILYMFSLGAASQLDWSVTTLVFVPIFYGTIVGSMLIYPFVLTVFNLVSLIRYRQGARRKMMWKIVEYITIVLGTVYTIIALSFSEIIFTADWYVVLSNSQVHTPIETGSMATVITLAIVGLAGYLLISLIPLKKMPPLVTVCGISAMYIGMGVCAVWSVQVSHLFLCLFPFNCIVIGIRTVLSLVLEWKQLQQERAEQGNVREYKNSLLRRLNKYLEESDNWPLAAFFLMWPLLGIVVCVLVLFGQQPDALIRAWTETSDWNLSRRIAPQNVYYDEHYLCTVAAGGHENVVKPLRLGVRHGHEVIVNRQLCVANAFEQLLEERLPRVHRHIRHFYDTYGFPVAKMIRSPYAADVVYILMKPLEWLFLVVLYFCDVNPENRIAVQYLPKRDQEGERIV